jgi:translation initiation factor 4G
MTIAEIHEQAAKESQQKALQAAQSARDARESISRGGSRSGHSRGGPQPGEWQSVNPTARPTSRPADFTQLGQFRSGAGAPSFGNSKSIFNKGRKTGPPGVPTPPLSRQPSNANMFGVLEAESATVDEAPQRKKLTLAPRTVPTADEAGESAGADAEGAVEGEEEGEASEADEETVTENVETGMSSSAAKVKIASDVKELWGEKDLGGSRNPADIVDYFKTLPEHSKHLLAEQLVDDLFRMNKPKDIEVVAKGFKATLSAEVATVETLRKG